MKKNVSRMENFADWYTWVVLESGLIMYGPTKGTICFLPKGWTLWNCIKEEIDAQFAKINVQNVQFPTLIKHNDFIKEKEHVEGFAPELFTVTKKGDSVLDEPLVLRPTSEITFSQVFKRVINSYNDLPLIYNQWCSVFRVEKNTRPFLRNTEFHWQELHAMHENSKKALKQTLKVLDIYDKFIKNYLCIATIVGEKTKNERFAGASNTFGIEALMQDGQALQCATSHYLGQTFSKTYDVKFQNTSNKFENCYQTSAGISTRLIGAVIMSHSDDNGLVLPFNIAPIQVGLICFPIDQKSKTGTTIAKVYKTLKKKYRASFDDSKKSIGSKIAKNEISGVPFTIILGPKDLEKNQVTFISRIAGEKKEISLNKLMSFISVEIKKYNSSLYKASLDRLNNSIVKVKNKDEFVQILELKKMALCPWCDDSKLESEIKEKYGATIRVIKSTSVNKDDKCFYSNEPAKMWVYFARAY